MRLLTAGLLGAMALSTAGCYATKTLSLNDVNGLRPSLVWVTLADESTVLLEEPRLRDNQLGGFVNRRFRSLPAADVKSLRWRQPAQARTAVLFGATVFGMSAVAYVLSGPGTYVDPCTTASSECIPGEVPTP